MRLSRIDNFVVVYVFDCAMVAYHRDRNRFSWIVRTAFVNWSEPMLRKLTKMLKKEGIEV